MNSNPVIDRAEIPIAPPRQQFLRFQLQPSSPHQVAPLCWSIEIDRVTELVNLVIDRVVPMPQLPPAVMGVYNWRGEILWIIDLATLLGVIDPAPPRRHRRLQPTMIINSSASNSLASEQQQLIGLMVDEILEIEWCDQDLIKSDLPVNIDPKLSKWVAGSWQSIAGEILPILGVDTILLQRGCG